MTASILVAEDDESIREILEARLRAEGYDVTVVNDGQEALHFLAHSDADVVLLDIWMPKVNGQQVLEVIRETAPECEVVILTADHSQETLVDCLRSGAFDVITKPFRVADLHFTVERALERRRLRVSTELFKASQLIFSAHDFERLPERIVEVTKKAMNADDVSVMIPNALGQLALAHSYGLPDADVAAARTISEENIAGRVARGLAPVVLQGDLKRDERFPGLGGRRPILSSIVFPLRSGSRVVGVLNINRTVNPRPFRTADIDRAGVLASHFVLALENARLVDRMVNSERLTTIGRLAAGVAHEINNPVAYAGSSLAFIRERLDAVQGTRPDAFPGTSFHEISEALVDAISGVARVAEIVADMSGISRGDDGEAKEFDVNDAVRAAIRIVMPQIRASGNVSASIDEVAFVKGSPGKLSQVFVNLLANAVQATADQPRERRTLTICTKVEADRVLVEVSDLGSGITTDARQRLFEPFFTTKPPGEGLGLGLPISREIVQRHGGDILVRSEPGVGTTFTVALPALGAIEAVEASPRKLRVLFVDDEPAIGRSYRRSFREEFEVTVAGGGLEALKLIEETEFDVVVCDLWMPDLTGMDLYDQIARARPDVAAKFVFATGSIGNPRVKEFMATLRNNRVVPKSRPMSELREIVIASSVAC